MNALFDQKTFRKTLNEMKKMNSPVVVKGSRQSPLLLLCITFLYGRPPFFKFNIYGDQVQAKQEKVKRQVRAP